MIIQDLLPEASLLRVEHILNQEENWSKKPLTGNTKDPKFKNNKEYRGSDRELIEHLLMEALNQAVDWRMYVVAPKSSSECLCLKYEEGDHYQYHADVGKGTKIQSLHYANTLFLSDPDEYEGGYLELEINNEAQKYKLSKNTLLTYPVGTKHFVHPVLKGVRKVIVFWTESFITDANDRKLLREIGYIHHEILKITSSLFDIKKTSSNPYIKPLVDLTRISESIHSKYPRYREAGCPLITE